jgi:reactive chlorine resistance protein C
MTDQTIGHGNLEKVPGTSRDGLRSKDPGTVHTIETDRALFAVFDTKRTRRLAGVGRAVLRYGLVALLLLWGSFKFAEFEAEGIRPLVEHSPILSWVYELLGVRGGAGAIGVIEIAAAVLIALRRWRPDLSALGSLLAAGTFLVTLSFLVSTPGVFAPTNPFGGFLMKDVILLGAALDTAAEALDAAKVRRQWTPRPTP